ncbi:14115_t:CDS:10 [Cetraspora pellucida]|uniref:14115_t:CDS:1 n=1 Tax=Cetraspora pellucida TaxID=1433469 RepID=A0A9N8W883_9GLOM|nr:14115_t:CDS:10 [Cetraspora pellucida]
MTKKLQRDRSALDIESSKQVDYLKDEVAYRLVDRLLDIKRKYDTIVDLGCGCGHVVKHIDQDITKKLLMCDMSEKMLERDKNMKFDVEVERIVVDEELLPFAENSVEAVISNLSLHWVNDLPGTMIQIQRSLKPDGLFLASMFSGDTLFELRTSLQLAELEREQGVSPRVSPMIDIRDVGSLLARAGFTLTTIDVDDIIVNYPTMFELIKDLKAMGESNAVLARRPFLKRDTLLAAAAIYKDLHGNSDGTIPATFQIGWKPDVSQSKPKPRGSATMSLKDMLEK